MTDNGIRTLNHFASDIVRRAKNKLERKKQLAMGININKINQTEIVPIDIYSTYYVV